MALTAKQWLEEIRGLALPPAVRIMNVCGGHERAITMAGLRQALPANVELIPGPGCPVCICPQGDVYAAMQIAIHEEATVVAFGDMLRVPVNVPRREIGSLEEARAAGADIRPIASPTEAVTVARNNPGRRVVFFAAGFETTTAPVAAMLQEGVPENLLLLLSGRLTWPAVAALLASGDADFDALIAPGHVSTVMGPEEWEFVPQGHGIPAAVAGFTPLSLLAGMYSVLRQLTEDRCFLDNCYPEVVRPGGNAAARAQLRATMQVVDAAWRGIGVIPKSGFELRPEFAAHDARAVYPEHTAGRDEEMPPGCQCADVVLGKIYPNECAIYGNACTPRHPIGPCMVSDEGACRIWWAAGKRASKAAVIKTG